MEMENDKAAKKRISLDEYHIGKLAVKFIELQSNFKSLTRNEMVPYIQEIINEIEEIEITSLKYENMFLVSEIDKDFNKDIGVKIESNIEVTKNNINLNQQELKVSKDKKDY
ncbi:MAG: hypothetical protein MJ252_16720, partial [archaeon]|nr:hypothetical protein [archaeon]